MDLIYWIITILILLLITFLPRIGLLARYKAYRVAQEREQMEDALKHLLDREQEGRHASPESMAGTLGLSRLRVKRLIEDMEAKGLLDSRGTELYLTPAGERWAMHVVRAHRLWERYLADEARMPLEQIHTEAHRREHNFTDAQLDELDAALGHPTHDPHGDPIPTRQGTLPKVEGVPVTAWQDEHPARIVHLEDEPALAYQQILAAGLRLGQDIRVLERTPQRVVLSDGENEYRLAPAVASNVHVAALPEAQLLKRESVPLTELSHNQRGEIVMLDEAVQGFTRRRFLDLGLTPGSIIYPELNNFFGDPRAYRVRGTMIALRKDQAEQIWVKPV
jgi:DtxR family Mn-dependent transcriptional regulator